MSIQWFDFLSKKYCLIHCRRRTVFVPNEVLVQGVQKYSVRFLMECFRGTFLAGEGMKHGKNTTNFLKFVNLNILGWLAFLKHKMTRHVVMEIPNLGSWTFIIPSWGAFQKTLWKKYQVIGTGTSNKEENIPCII